MLTRIVKLVTVLMLACASAHAYAPTSPAETAHRGHSAADQNRFQEVDALSAERAKEKSVESVDASIERENYLRARYLDPASGRFTQMDSFSGIGRDPNTLHKYLYVHADPANNIDPTGHIEVSLQGLMRGVSALSTQIGVRVAVWAMRNPGKAFFGNVLSSITANLLLPRELQVPMPMTFPLHALGATAETIKSAGKQLSLTARHFVEKNGILSGGSWEEFLSTALRIDRNTRQMFSVDLTWLKNARFRPDYLFRGGFLEAKAVRELSSHDILQAEKMAAYASREGKPLTYMFLKRPSQDSLEKLEQAIAEGANGRQISFDWYYLFD